MKNEPDATVLLSPEEPWQVADRMVLELAPGLEDLFAALREHDDAQIWRLHLQAPDQAAFLDWVAGSVSQHAAQRAHPKDPNRVSTWNQLLLFAPVVTTASSPAVPGTRSSDAHRPQALLAKLAQWAGAKQAVSLATTLVPYADVCRWSPLTQREMLMQLDLEKPRVQAPWSPHLLSVAEGMPQLSFVVGGIRRWLAQPELPDPAAAQPVSLHTMVAAQAAYAQQVPLDQVTAGAPQMPQEAVLCGLQLWLTAALETRRVVRWDVANGPQDVVQLLLFGEDEQILAVVPVRLHQLPPYALDLLLEQLAREVPAATARQL